MYVPPTLGQPTAALAPVSIVASAPASATPPARATLRVTSSQLNVLDGQRASVTGTLAQREPRLALAGDLLTLQELSRHGWRGLAHTRTRANGRFRLTFTPRNLGSAKVRLLFAGNSSATAARQPLGRLNVYRLAGGLVVRRRRRARVWRLADQLDARRGQQDASLRDPGHAALRRTHPARARHRSRPVRRRPRIRPHRSDQARSRIRRHRPGLDDGLE